MGTTPSRRSKSSAPGSSRLHTKSESAAVAPSLPRLTESDGVKREEHEIGHRSTKSTTSASAVRFKVKPQSPRLASIIGSRTSARASHTQSLAGVGESKLASKHSAMSSLFLSVRKQLSLKLGSPRRSDSSMRTLAGTSVSNDYAILRLTHLCSDKIKAVCLMEDVAASGWLQLAVMSQDGSLQIVRLKCAYLQSQLKDKFKDLAKAQKKRRVRLKKFKAKQSARRQMGAGKSPLVPFGLSRLGSVDDSAVDSASSGRRSVYSRQAPMDDTMSRMARQSCDDTAVIDSIAQRRKLSRRSAMAKRRQSSRKNHASISTASRYRVGSTMSISSMASLSSVSSMQSLKKPTPSRALPPSPVLASTSVASTSVPFFPMTPPPSKELPSLLPKAPGIQMSDLMSGFSGMGAMALKRSSDDILVDCSVLTLSRKEIESVSDRDLDVCLLKSVSSRSHSMTWLMAMQCSPTGARIAIGDMNGSLSMYSVMDETLKESVDLSSDFIAHCRFVSESTVVYTNGNGQIVVLQTELVTATGTGSDRSSATDFLKKKKKSVIFGKRVAQFEYLKLADCTPATKTAKAKASGQPVAAFDCTLLSLPKTESMEEETKEDSDSGENASVLLLMTFVYAESNIVNVLAIDLDVILNKNEARAKKCGDDASAIGGMLLKIDSENLRRFAHYFAQFNIYDCFECWNKGVKRDSLRYGSKKRHAIQAKAMSTSAHRSPRFKPRMTPRIRKSKKQTVVKSVGFGDSETDAMTKGEKKKLEKLTLSQSSTSVVSSVSVEESGSEEATTAARVSERQCERQRRAERLLAADKCLIPLCDAAFSPRNKDGTLFLAIGNENSDFWILKQRDAEFEEKEEEEEGDGDCNGSSLMGCFEFDCIYFYDSVVNDVYTEVMIRKYCKEQLCGEHEAGGIDLLRAHSDLYEVINLAVASSTTPMPLSDYSLATGDCALRGKSSVYRAVLTTSIAGLNCVTPAKLTWSSGHELVRVKAKCELDSHNLLVCARLNDEYCAKHSIKDVMAAISDGIVKNECLSSFCAFYSPFFGLDDARKRKLVAPIVCYVTHFLLASWCRVYDDAFYCQHPFGEFLSRLTPSSVDSVPLTVVRSGSAGIGQCLTRTVSPLSGSFLVGCHDSSAVLFIPKSSTGLLH